MKTNQPKNPNPATAIPESEDTRNTIQKIPDLKKFDYPIAAIITHFSSENCIFCQNNSKCSKRRKEALLKIIDDHPGSGMVCKDFMISTDLCFIAIHDALAAHPEYRTDAVNRKTTSELDDLEF